MQSKPRSSEDALSKALDILERGGVVGIPTETVYGLAARLDRPEGIERIFTTKARPFFDPLIVHGPSKELLRSYASEWSDVSEALATEFWPGPLTLVVPKTAGVSDMVTSGLSTVGLRVPRQPLTLELLRRVNVGLPAPSANRFGRTSPTRAEHVVADLGDQVFVLDGGPCEVGIESTVITVEDRGVQILRLGALSGGEISAALTKRGVPFEWIQSSQAVSPGQVKHHYMPPVPLVWLENASSLEGLAEKILPELALLPTEWEGVPLIRPQVIKSISKLHLPRDPILAARSLYHELRVQSVGADLLVFVLEPWMQAPEWAAILERLRKAALIRWPSNETP